MTPLIPYLKTFNEVLFNRFNVFVILFYDEHPVDYFWFNLIGLMNLFNVMMLLDFLSLLLSIYLKAVAIVQICLNIKVATPEQMLSHVNLE